MCKVCTHTIYMIQFPTKAIIHINFILYLGLKDIGTLKENLIIKKLFLSLEAFLL